MQARVSRKGSLHPPDAVVEPGFEHTPIYSRLARRAAKPTCDPPQSPPRILHGPADEIFLRHELLGRGASSECYRVEQLDRAQYAMKVVSRRVLEAGHTRRNLTREILINWHIHNPRIVTFHMHFFDSANIYLCLEYCPNGSLSQLIKSRKGLTETEACNLAVNIALGLEFLHENLIVHRDLKPGNILLDENMRPKIADFGLAVVLPNKHAKIHSFAGTPCYLAPEVIKKPRNYGMEVDIWSLGTVLYTMVFGRSPFVAKQTSDIYRLVCHGDVFFSSLKNPSLELCSLVNSMLNRTPASRPHIRGVLTSQWVKEHFVHSLPKSILTTPFEVAGRNCSRAVYRFLRENPPPPYTAFRLFRDYVSRELQDPIAPCASNHASSSHE